MIENPITRQRQKITVRGAVQGVGFRPMVYRLATQLDLTGWVINATDGVHIEIEGETEAVETFLERLPLEAPEHALIRELTSALIDPVESVKFEIRESEESHSRSTLILPDLTTCPECRRELLDPKDRRHRYPFTNCTHCGPRFTILKSLPYDRPNTTMASFEMCDKCRAEYENPLDRRFHAQPNACPECGPQLALWNSKGREIAIRDDALRAAEVAIEDGIIVAIKGLGGFHLVVDARNSEAVTRLRNRKHREEKPFAVMVPDLRSAEQIVELDDTARELLTSRQAPIVLLKKRAEASGIASEVAPRNPQLGVMLPYTPLHILLMQDLGFPIVATSGNMSDEPICIDEREALERMKGIAELFLVHDRPIARHVDDSVVRVVESELMVARRARGYAPLPIRMSCKMPPTLAAGAHLKNSVALAVGQEAFVSQHIGDLETKPALDAFHEVIGQFEGLYETELERVVHDLHPDYHSSQWAKTRGLPRHEVQHHVAHIYSCMAEHELKGPVCGISWDGTGLGVDGTIWGGEFFIVNGERWRRFASLRQFPLPGGEKAIREPRRTALGLLAQQFGIEAALERVDLLPLVAFTQQERTLIGDAIRKGINTPMTSSMGRLFDAVSSLAGIRQIMSFEGQAAMELEWALPAIPLQEAYPFPVIESNGNEEAILRFDWQPLLDALLADLAAGIDAAIISSKFHNALVELAVHAAKVANIQDVAISGGVFQNRYLTEQTIRRLREEGFTPHWQRQVPPNDGGISLGQLYAASFIQR